MKHEAIVIAELTKRYGSTVAVDNVHLVVKSGELFGFLGPNGAGKTTTMQIIATLLCPTAGKVTVAGYDVFKEPLAVKQSIGYLAEHPFLYDQLTGREFLRFSGGLHKMDSLVIARRSEYLLEMLNLTNKGNDLIKSYSQGMRQKIALCASLLHEPQLLLLDEPTNGLDPLSARQVKVLLRQRVTEGTTVFLSTHILEVAERLCDRLGIIFNGRLIAVGTLEELRQQSQLPGSTLEEVFLTLTKEADDGRLRVMSEGAV